MMNLTEVFLNSAPSRIKISFGVNKNVMLKSADNTVRRDKNGVRINKNCYLTFAVVDVEDENRVTAQSTYSYFNIDKPNYAFKGFVHQFNHLIEIATAVVPKSKLGAVLTPLNNALKADIELFKEISKSDGVPSAKKTKEVAALQTKVVDLFIEAITPYTGDKGDLVNLAIITDPKGTFYDLPREDKGFISKVDGGRVLSIDAKYLRWYAEKDKAETAEGEDIGSEEIIEEEEILIVGDNLEDI